ncbi:hypothetical protein [Mycobacterium sp. DL]|uniref:Adenylate kinase n=1 Tax=Mycolicibacterium hippocampi TaxID=659824 RepID=A0A850PNA8_9MYCO|nr:hypothetical protein [Mycolicibacterium hippocampi]
MRLEEIARQVASAGVSTVLIDGRSGSGKSTLAEHLHRVWPTSSVVRLDDIYPGWDGLDWAIEHLRTELLAPRAAGLPGRWRRWNWDTGAPDGWHTVDPHRRLIVEGVGALAASHRPLAELGIWVETPDDVRKQRALDRDGDTYRPHWDRWAAQEETFLIRDAPRIAADYVATEDADGQSWTLTRNESRPA